MIKNSSLAEPAAPVMPRLLWHCFSLLRLQRVFAQINSELAEKRGIAFRLRQQNTSHPTRRQRAKPERVLQTGTHFLWGHSIGLQSLTVVCGDYDLSQQTVKRGDTATRLLNFSSGTQNGMTCLRSSPLADSAISAARNIRKIWDYFR